VPRQCYYLHHLVFLFLKVVLLYHHKIVPLLNKIKLYVSYLLMSLLLVAIR
jgi:hypothetical protein